MNIITNIKKWLKRRTLVSVHLKSGAIINVRCESFELRKEYSDLTAYTFSNMKAGNASYIRIGRCFGNHSQVDMAVKHLSQVEYDAAKQRLYNLCQKFIIEQKIYSEESIFQTDRVVENSYCFIAEICDIVGYLEFEGEE